MTKTSILCRNELPRKHERPISGSSGGNGSGFLFRSYFVETGTKGVKAFMDDQLIKITGPSARKTEAR